MSGPPYPHPNPVPGSNAIGSFQIGISPLGDIPPFDVWATIISQYAASDRIDAMITSFAAAMEMTENFDDLYDWMWNVATAQGYGLDCLGRIVGVSRTISLNSTLYFGFQEAGSWTGFGQGPLYSGPQLGSSYNLSDDNFRTLIYAKAAANICSGSIPAINQILLTLFPNRGACYVTDGQDMTMTYTFKFPLSQIELAIIGQSGVLPKPAGVAASVVAS